MDQIPLFGFCVCHLSRNLYVHPVEIWNQTVRWEVLPDNLWIFVRYGSERMALPLIHHLTRRHANVEVGAFPPKS